MRGLAETRGVRSTQTIVSRLERTAAVAVFTIKTETAADLTPLQPDVASWPRSSLAILRGTTLGAADFTVYYPSATARFAMRDGKLVPIPRDEWRSLRMDDQFDALLYLGPPPAITFSRMTPALCIDPPYMKMRLERLELVGPPGEGDRLKKDCAPVGPE